MTLCVDFQTFIHNRLRSTRQRFKSHASAHHYNAYLFTHSDFFLIDVVIKCPPYLHPFSKVFYRTDIIV